MYNFLVAAGITPWDDEVYEFQRERVAIEYTEDSISERYRELDTDVIAELKDLPTLFCVEGEQNSSRVGWITSIKVKPRKVRIEFVFESSIAPLEPGFIANASILLNLGRFELGRTHWAIKDGDLWAILERRRIDCTQLKPENRSSATQNIKEENGITDTKPRVFIVHGHDDVAKYEMAAELRDIGCEPIILHEQASSGLTIIEKMERFTDVGFAVVLYTPCDVGGKSQSEIVLRSRARQNVVFEHGYLIAKLGRDKVMAFVRGNVETPTDISGVLYIDLDQSGVWKEDLRKELKAAGYIV